MANFDSLEYTGTSPKTGEAPYSSYVEGVKNKMVSLGLSNYSPTQCTGGCSARSINAGLASFENLGSAVQGASNGSGNKTEDYRNIEAGDIIVFGFGSKWGLDGHVAFVESVNGSTMRVSEAANTGNHPFGLGVFDININTGAGGNHWGWSDEKFNCILKNKGNGGGHIDPTPIEPPEDPPTPGERGHYEPIYEDIESEYDTNELYMGGPYECASDSFAGDSGTQDSPKAPKGWGTATTRHDFKWDPLYCYTEERALTYDASGNPVGGQGEIVSSGVNTVPENKINIPIGGDGGDENG